MDVSVILCTYNRCVSLRRTLNTFCELRNPQNISWELLIIDNNSTDQTPEVCGEFSKRLPIHHIFEPTPGQSAARNRGIMESKGNLLIFTDDDVDIDPDWIAAYGEAAARNVAAQFFGGRILTRWDCPPPKWMVENYCDILRGVVVTFDHGDKEREIVDRHAPAVGANFALRRAVLDEFGFKFREDLGLKPQQEVRFEEFAFLQQLLDKGRQGRYLPQALVYHRQPPERMTERYVRRFYEGFGIALVRLGQAESGNQWLFGVPRWWWRKLFESACGYVFTRFTSSSSTWLQHECTMAKRWGAIGEMRALRRRGVQYVMKAPAAECEF
jgi:glycosyltransferase involved in cell wall biosynthesis